MNRISGKMTTLKEKTEQNEKPKKLLYRETNDSHLLLLLLSRPLYQFYFTPFPPPIPSNLPKNSLTPFKFISIVAGETPPEEEEERGEMIKR